MRSVSVLMLAYNEEANVGPCMEEALAFLDEHVEDHELVVVDDGSKDGTADAARAIAAKHPERVRVVSYAPNRGIGGALLEGAEHCTKEWVTWLPADGQVPPSGLLNLMAIVDADPRVGLVTCTFPARFEEADHFGRKVLSRGLRVAIYLLTGVVLQTDGTWLVRRRVIYGLPLRSRSFFLNLELPIRARRAGHRAGHATMHIRPRMSGESKVANASKIKLVLKETAKLGAELRFGYLP